MFSCADWSPDQRADASVVREVFDDSLALVGADVPPPVEQSTACFFSHTQTHVSGQVDLGDVDTALLVDYWDTLDFSIVDALEPKKPCYFFSTKGKRPYTEAAFEKDAQLTFGSETAGLPPEIHEQFSEQIYTIPMLPEARSLNLSNSVAIVLYEALRQHEFKGLR